MTLEEIFSAIAWTDNQFESMKKVALAVASLAKEHGATDQEIARVAAESVGYSAA